MVISVQMSHSIAGHHGQSVVLNIIAQILMHVQTLGCIADLWWPTICVALPAAKPQQCADNIIQYKYIILLSKLAIDLLATWQVFSHVANDHHGLPTIHIKLINANSDACTPSWLCKYVKCYYRSSWTLWCPHHVS